MLAQPEPVDETPDARTARLERKFTELIDACSRFSGEIARDMGWSGPSAPTADLVGLNLEIGRAVFGKWSLDILTFLFLRHMAGFQEIRKSLGRISSRVLSSKLTRLQDTGLVQRDVKPTRPPRVAYSLTDRGLAVAKLGEPVYLYLRLTGERRPVAAPP